MPDTTLQPVRALYRATAVIALLGVLLSLVGIVGLLRPVETPTQDCGTSLAVLLQGRPNEFVDPNDLPDGVTAAEAQDNNERPCRDRVADQAATSAWLIAGGLVVALLATIVEVAVRALARHGRHRALRDADAPDDAPDTAATEPEPEAGSGPEPAAPDGGDQLV